MPKDNQVCAQCRRPRTPHDSLDYDPMQVLFGQRLGWYSGDDAEICPECMTQVVRPR